MEEEDHFSHCAHTTCLSERKKILYWAVYTEILYFSVKGVLKGFGGIFCMKTAEFVQKVGCYYVGGVLVALEHPSSPLV